MSHVIEPPVASERAPTRTKPAPLSASEAGVTDPGYSEVLTPKLPAHWALQGKHLLIIGVFCLLFMHYNYLPLFHSDVWGHVAYGEWIIDHGRLPVDEPFVRLAEGMPVVCTAWLGQVVLAAAGRAGDAEWYSHLFAITAVVTSLVLMRTFYLQTGRGGIAALAMVLAWLIGWSRHAVIRPEMFGNLCFALLLWLVVRTDAGRARRSIDGDHSIPACLPAPWLAWIGVPVLFALWANLHGSFIVGFAVLGCYTLGRAIEIVWQTRSVTAVLGDGVFRRWALLTELAVLGTLANPYGFDLLMNTLLFPSNPNLKDVIEWFPLEMVSLEGVPMAASWVLIVVLLRHSRVRVAPSDVLLLAVFTLAVCLKVRMVAWYAPVVMIALTPHLADVIRQLADSAALAGMRRAAQPLLVGSFRLTLIAPLFLWVTFAFSPISRPVLGGKPRPAERLYSKDTPLGVTMYLREHVPQGLVAGPQWWGDWLVWDGPKGIDVMMTTNSVHVVPPRVWRDYLAIAQAAPGLERRLNRYRVNTIVVCKELQTQLEPTVRQMNGWNVVYEDDVGLIAVRSRAHIDENLSVEEPAE